jgi:CheY-like chemotaxis protein
MAGRRILVVDDDVLVASTFEAFLSGDGHDVDTAGSAEEALAKFRAAPYDLVITDLTLPHMTGLELARALRQVLPHQPIILTSGSPQATEISNLGHLPVNLLLGKPFVAADLQEALARTLSAP